MTKSFDDPILGPEFNEFKANVGSILTLPSGRALAFRRKLGASIDSKLSSFPKGIVQQKKSLFVQTALEISGVRWESKEPHKIISNLKNSGNGHEDVSLALLFLCHKTNEFDDIRDPMPEILTASGLYHGDVQIKLPTPIYHLADILATQSLVKFGFDRPPPIGGALKIDQKLAETIEANQNGALRTSAQKEASGISDEKISGRIFLERDLYKSISAQTNHGVSSLSIIDIDDMTKINKVHGHDAGDAVIDEISSIISFETKGLRSKIGRCGDDTFYIVLYGGGMKVAFRVADTVKRRTSNHFWGAIAEGLRVSISIGVAREKEQESSVAFAVRAAVGMKAAKEHGGDCVMPGPVYLVRESVLRVGETKRYWS